MTCKYIIDNCGDLPAMLLNKLRLEHCRCGLFGAVGGLPVMQLCFIGKWGSAGRATCSAGLSCVQYIRQGRFGVEMKKSSRER